MTRSNQARMIVLVSALLCAVHFADARADVLAVPEVEQEESQWCWAGVSQSILRYYDTTVAQCEIAEYARSSRPEYYGTVDCCVDSTQGCNQPNGMIGPGTIEDILIHFGSIDSHFVNGVLSSDDCATEIANYRPFNIRWGWSGGGGHFVVGHGIELSDVGGDHTFYYMNPWYGEGLSVATYAWVVEGSNHTWTSTNRIDTVPDCICFSVETCCDDCRPFEDGLVCDDGDPLTTLDVCTAGICEGDSGPSCDVDSDGDGVMDCIDVCPGFDDTLDCNGNGVPDGCDIEGGPFEYEHKLTADDGAANDQFGTTVKIDGDAFVVAAPYDDYRGTDSGSVYVYRRDTGGWVHEQKLTASDGEAGDSFGRYLSIHGDTIAVGAWGDDDRGYNAGAVYVYRYDGSGAWDLEQKLTAPDGDADDEFGEDVSIHGDTIAIGAWADEDRGNQSGSVYVYRYNGIGAWDFEQKLTAADGVPYDRFGYRVSIHGDTIVVGAVEDDDLGDASGSAYVYRYDGSGAWDLEQKLNASDGEAWDIFGLGVSIHRDTIHGDAIVVAAPYNDDPVLGTDAGSAYVFRHDPTRSEGDRWVEEQKLTANDGAASDYFGDGVSIHGDTIAIGAWADDDPGLGTDAGSAYVFRYDRTRSEGDRWVEEQKLTAPDGAIEDWLGYGVAVGGGTIVAGSNGRDDRGTESGAVYTFERLVTSSDCDLDGVPDECQPDTDLDGLIDACDDDDDGDGTPDLDDGCPLDADKIDPGACGCGVPDSDTDSDGDGVVDCVDQCPGAPDNPLVFTMDWCPDDPNKIDPGQCGCGVPDIDSDGDGVADCVDQCPGAPDNPLVFTMDWCPGDPNKIDPGQCGCGVPDTDSDGDCVADCVDQRPGEPDTDADGDGVADCVDQCPGQPDTDADGDGIADCVDECPAGTGDPVVFILDLCPGDPNKIDPGQCGCGQPETDLDGDGYYCASDCNDASAGSWATPGEVDGLRFGAGTKDDLSWDAPAEPSGDAPRYDTVRSDFANDFGAATCIESGDGSDRTATDVAVPAPGTVFHYLVRAENDCPAGQGTLGHDSQGVERSAPICP